MSPPPAIEYEDKAVGAAALAWADIEPALMAATRQLIEDAVGKSIQVLGMRFLDAGGRGVDGVTVVVAGFKLVGDAAAAS